MKKVALLSLLLLLLYSCGIGYLHNPLSEDSCSVKYNAIYQDEGTYILVEIESENLVFSNKVSMKLKTFNNDIIELNGTIISSTPNNGGIIISGIMYPINETNSKALFSITEKQIYLLKSGISKVRISTIPIAHEKIFDEDFIGVPLYNEFIQKKEENNKF